MDDFFLKREDLFVYYFVNELKKSSAFNALARTNRALYTLCARHGNVHHFHLNFFVHSVPLLRWYEPLSGRHKKTLIAEVARAGNIETMRAILQEKPDVTQIEYALDMAAYSGQTHIIDILTKETDARPSHVTLQMCIIYNQPATAIWLIQNGCQMNIHNLFAAIERWWEPKLFFELIKHGCPYDRSITPYAIAFGNVDVVNWAVDKNLYCVHDYFVAIKYECPEIIEILRVILDV